MLEYAANGDLHSAVVGEGALDTHATVFVLGSIVAARGSRASEDDVAEPPH